MLNLALLIGGYGVGQGSIFLAQTWLVAHGELELLALFGTHFAFAMFGIIAVEAGSLTILARHAASMQEGEESVPAMWRHFWEMSVVRGAMALVVVAASLGFMHYLASSPFSRGYVLCALPAFLFWAVNAAGFLDGLRLSGISGISGSIAYAASAGTLVYAQGLDPASAGAALGAAFSAGYLLTVMVQFAALRVAGWRLRFVAPKRRGIARAGIDGLALLGSTLPGQVYFRAQLLMSAAWLGAEPTALFLYVKQIVTAAIQLTGFFRRVEFPALVQTLQQDATRPLHTIWHLQIRGTQLALVATCALFIAGLGMTGLAEDMLTEIGRYLAAFAFVIFASASLLAFGQGLAALGHYNALLVRSLLAAVVGLSLSALLSSSIGILAFAIADIVSMIVSTLAAMYFLRRIGKHARAP